MKMWAAPNRCGCDADVTMESAVVPVPLVWTKVPRRAKFIFHYRKRDEAHFWHWSDQKVVKI
jgi:hypothetical protein